MINASAGIAMEWEAKGIAKGITKGIIISALCRKLSMEETIAELVNFLGISEAKAKRHYQRYMKNASNFNK